MKFALFLQTVVLKHYCSENQLEAENSFLHISSSPTLRLSAPWTKSHTPPWHMGNTELHTREKRCLWRGIFYPNGISSISSNLAHVEPAVAGQALPAGNSPNHLSSSIAVVRLKILLPALGRKQDLSVSDKWNYLNFVSDWFDAWFRQILPFLVGKNG